VTGRFHTSRLVIDKIVAHAREAKPRECCGVLLGKDDEIVDAVGARNLAEEPTRYLIDPQDHILALRDGRRRGLDVIGFYHSHPHSVASPSPRDLEEASYPDCVYLIASLAAEPPDVRLFRLDARSFVGVDLIVGGD
jgi:proteasome lid subunit RPN8/RPN11